MFRKSEIPMYASGGPVALRKPPVTDPPDGIDAPPTLNP